MAIGALGAGLLKGLVEKKKYERQKEIEDQQMRKADLLYKMQEQQLKQQQLAYEKQIKAQEALSSYFQNIQGQSQQPPIQEQPQSVLDALVRGFSAESEQIPQADTAPQGVPQGQGIGSPTDLFKDPYALYLMKQAGMGDFSGLGRLSEQVSNNERLARQGQERINIQKQNQQFAQSEVVWREKVIDGEKWAIPFNKLGKQISNPNIQAYKIEGKKGLPLEAATKASGMQAGIEGINIVRNAIIKPDGTVDRAKLWQLKPIPGINNAAPDWVVRAWNSFSGKKPQPAVGQQFFTYIAQAYESLIRGESGAAVPDTEITRLAKRYGIDWTMDDATIKTRMAALQNILGGTVELLDPQKRHRYNQDYVTFREYEDGRKEYIGLPDETGYTVGKQYQGENGQTAEYLGGGKWQIIE